ncbi:DNA internalization-related competence protein ComEC/Rec2 [Undibacterium squillarum]|uniref:DNA internalization-related competence protein ComEC/Rec2 n=1 Tax=Undibacterium squillarum TaxID=1131567 RepID=UPI0035B0B7F4
MRRWAAGFLAGTLILQQQATLINAYANQILIAVLFLHGLWWWLRRHTSFKSNTNKVQRRHHWCSLLVSPVLGLLAGLSWAHWQACDALQTRLPPAFDGQEIQALVQIDGLPYRNDTGWHFTAKLLQADWPANIDTVHPPQKLSANWFPQREALPELISGQCWQMQLRLKQIHGTANPGGFDSELWALEQGLDGAASVRAASLRPCSDAGWSATAQIARWRASLRDRIFAALPEQRYAAVVVALVIGEQRGISQDDWSMLMRSGIGHLISISGSHITMIAALVAWLCGQIWRRSAWLPLQPALPLRCPTQHIMLTSGVITAWLYVALAGFGVPAQRTAIILTVAALAAFSGIPWRSSQILAMALALVLISDPWAAIWPGFWLSFGAVAALMAVVQPDPEKQGKKMHWRQKLMLALHSQWALMAAMLPACLFWFGQFSLVSPFTNAIAIPVIGWLVTPLALFGCLLPDALAKLVWQLAHLLLSWLMPLMEWMVAPAWAVWQRPVPEWPYLLLATVGSLILLLPRRWPLRWLGLCGWLPLLLPVPLQQAGLVVRFLDVGQGMAVLVETPHHRLLYDTGPAWSAGADAGARIVLPYLQSRGISKLDAVIISHQDTDHSGGAASIAKNIATAQWYSSLPEQHALHAHMRPHQRCEAGMRWHWDDVDFEFLQPAAVSYTSDKWKPNARSCVLRIAYRDQVILLAGDIEAVQEDEMLQMLPDKLRANVLLVPHHGSGTSSTPAFLQAVQPEWAVFQLGYRNRYRHPRADVWQRYADFGVKRLRSDSEGAIQFVFSETTEVSSYRRDRPRYWQTRADGSGDHE